MTARCLRTKERLDKLEFLILDHDEPAPAVRQAGPQAAYEPVIFSFLPPVPAFVFHRQNRARLTVRVG